MWDTHVIISTCSEQSTGDVDRLSPPNDPTTDGKGVMPVQSKAMETITIRTTVTTTVKIERSSETQESTTRPVIVVVLDSKG